MPFYQINGDNVAIDIGGVFFLPSISNIVNQGRGNYVFFSVIADEVTRGH
jgi:hypothetical protein